MRPNTRTKEHRASAHRQHRNFERILRRFRQGESTGDIIEPGTVAWAQLNYVDPIGTAIQPVIALAKPDSEGRLLVLRVTSRRRPELTAFDWRTTNLPRRSWAHPLPVKIHVDQIVGFAGRVDPATISGTPIGEPTRRAGRDRSAVTVAA